MVIMALAVPALLLTAAVAHVRASRALAHVARAGALAASLGLAWLSHVDGAHAQSLYQWLHMAGLRLDAGVALTGSTAAVVAAAVLWSAICPLLDDNSSPSTAAAMDLAAAGAVTCCLASGIWWSLAGCEVLLVAAYLYGCTVSNTASARRLLLHTRLCSAALVGALVFADTSAAMWLALLAAAILVGGWPFHTWLEDLGPGGPATGIRLLTTVVGVQILLRFATPLPVEALPVLLASGLLATIGALAAQDMLRSNLLLAAAHGALLLAAAGVSPQAALLLLTVLGASQVVQTNCLTRISASLPGVDARVTDLGGLAQALPWSRWLTQSGLLVVALSPSSLWAAALLAGYGWNQAGPVGAAVVGLFVALPVLPLVRLAVAPFSGPVRHATVSTSDGPVAARWAVVLVLAVVALGPAVVIGVTTPMPLSPAAGLGAGVAVVMLLVGYLLWHAGPRQVRLVEPGLRRVAAGGFGMPGLLRTAGAMVQATGQWLWTAVDGVLFSGLPGLLNLSVRAAGWALAWLHDGWSGWALATATGAAAILLWSLYGDAGSW